MRCDVNVLIVPALVNRTVSIYLLQIQLNEQNIQTLWLCLTFTYLQLALPKAIKTPLVYSNIQTKGKSYEN